MKKRARRISRRSFVKGAAASSLFTIVPPHVLGRGKHVPPSRTFGGALIGCGGRGPGTFNTMKKQFTSKGHEVELLAQCDVKFKGRADNKTLYTDFRRVLERKDIELIAIATPPHWHPLISIAAAEAGKDVLCEKPMTRFIAEGRAVVKAFDRYKRIFQIGTFGRFGQSRNRNSILTHKIMRSGLLKPNPGVYVKRGGLKVKQWSGKVNLVPTEPPTNLDWDLYLGPAPEKAFVRERRGGTHRNYWDYEGGGLSDMGQHTMDPFQWTYGKDDTSPVEIEAFAPPPHPECTGMWGWIELKYADGFTLVFDSGEWGDPYERRKARGISLNDLDEEGRKKIEAMPDPEPLADFATGVLERKQPGGNAEAAHRAATLMHLANIAIRTGRKLKYDPVKEVIVGDAFANRLVNVPMRSPWHL